MNFFSRLQGVFFSPKETLKAVSEKPVWIDALIVLLVLLIIFSAVIGPYLLQDSLQSLKNDVKRQERMGEEAFNRQLEFMENPPPWFRIFLTVVSPLLANLIGFFLPPLILLAMGRMFSTEGNYRQLLSVYIHASFVDKILGNAVRLVLILTRKSIFQTTTSIALFFPRLEVTSTAFRVLSQFDFFQLWLFGILGYGLSSVFKVELKKALFISYGFWFLKSLLYVGLGFLGR
jgi:hypothetical protein